MSTKPVSREGAKARRGLSKRLGDTGFSVAYGAHHPWEWRLLFNGECVAGIDDKFLHALRAFAPSREPTPATQAEVDALRAAVAEGTAT